MLGIPRTAVIATAFLLLSATWATAQSPRQQHVLPVGTAVVFVTDASLDAGRREGDVVSVHLRDALTLDGTVLAAAGTRASLVVGTTLSNGKRVPAISLDRFSISAGMLPVKSLEPIVPPLAAGALIEARTLAEVDHFGERVSIRIPFPFGLAGDQPAAQYTATPARTASPKMQMKPEPTPTPVPTAPPAMVPAPDTPAPAATKIPA